MKYFNPKKVGGITYRPPLDNQEKEREICKGSKNKEGKKA
jgi:hypothetical protein